MSISGKIPDRFFNVTRRVKKIVGGNDLRVWTIGGDLREAALCHKEIGGVAGGGPLVGHEQKMAQGPGKRLRIVEGVMND